jgi:hypothetical protein
LGNCPSSQNAREEKNPHVKSLSLSLHSRPKVVRIEEPGELGVDIDNMNIAFPTIANDRPIEIPCLIRFDIDTQGAKDLQPQTCAKPVSTL